MPTRLAIVARVLLAQKMLRNMGVAIRMRRTAAATRTINVPNEHALTMSSISSRRRDRRRDRYRRNEEKIACQESKNVAKIRKLPILTRSERNSAKEPVWDVSDTARVANAKQRTIRHTSNILSAFTKSSRRIVLTEIFLWVVAKRCGCAGFLVQVAGSMDTQLVGSCRTLMRPGRAQSLLYIASGMGNLR